jgi:hypothetical protein
MISLLLLELGIISTLTVLFIISDKRSGFVGLNNTPKVFLDHPKLAKALWPGFFYTVLPTFLMGIYNNFREGTLSAVWDRQPFVELAKKEKGGSPELTVMLDYSKAGWKRGIKALLNGHYVIAACAILGYVYSFGIVSLTSYLFTEYHFDMKKTLPAFVLEEFNSTTFSQSDFRPVLDTVTAIQLYDANQPAWVNGEYAFASFKADVTSGNVTIESLGYSANLDCVVITQSEYTLQNDNGSFIISTDDRGCNISTSFLLPVPPAVLMSAWAEQSCSLQSGSSRLLVVSSSSTMEDPQIPSNFSFISCIPTYWHTLGNLTINFGLTPEPSVATFGPLNGGSQFFLDSRITYEPALQTLMTFDAQSEIGGNDFGRLVYSFAKKLDSESPLDPQQVMTSTIIIYASIFAVFSSSAFFDPVSPAANTTCIVTESVTRLIVVQPICYAILSIMATGFLLTIKLLSYTSQPSILVEEPIGILATAAMLHESHIMEIVKEARSEAIEGDYRPFDGKVLERASEKLSGIVCYRDGTTPEDYKIVVRRKDPEPDIREARYSLLRRLKGFITKRNTQDGGDEVSGIALEELGVAC